MLYKLRMQFYVEAPIILNRIKKPYWKVSSAFISVPDYILIWIEFLLTLLTSSLQLYYYLFLSNLFYLLIYHLFRFSAY